jgi:hypothetical protein
MVGPARHSSMISVSFLVVSLKSPDLMTAFTASRDLRLDYSVS